MKRSRLDVFAGWMFSVMAFGRSASYRLGAAGCIRASNHRHALSCLFCSTTSAAQQQQQQQEIQQHETLTKTKINHMRIAELRQELVRRGLNAQGLKRDLIPRLYNDVQFTRILLLRRTETAYNSANDDETRRGTTDLIDDYTDITLDSTTTYSVQVKGLSNSSSNGTGIGICIRDDDSRNVVWQARTFLPTHRTVAQAESTGLVIAANECVRRGARRVCFQLDNDVVRNQLLSASKQDGLLKQVLHATQSLEECSFDLISHATNERANSLANDAFATGTSSHMRDVTDPMDETTVLVEQQQQQDARERLSQSPPPEPDFTETTLEVPSSLADSPNTTENLQELQPLMDLDTKSSALDPSITYVLQFDGGARGNPKGISGAGMVLYDNQDEEVWCGWAYLDAALTTNNMAEYMGLLIGLKCALSLGVRKILVQGDSQLIQKQVTGEYKVKDAKLKPLHKSTMQVIAGFDEFRIEHIYRNQNSRADALANQAMDTKTSHGFDNVD